MAPFTGEAFFFQRTVYRKKGAIGRGSRDSYQFVIIFISVLKEAYLKPLKKQRGRVELFTLELWYGMADCVTVGKEMVFTFRDGTEVAV